MKRCFYTFFSFLSSLFNIKKSIQAKVFISFTILILITFLFITKVWHNNVNHLIQNSTVSHVIDVTKNSNLNLENKLNDIGNITEIIATDEDTIKNMLLQQSYNSPEQKLYQINDFMQGFFSLMYSSIYGIAVADMNGSVYKVGTPYVPMRYLEKDWVQNIIEAEGNCIYTLKNIYTGANTIEYDKPSYITVGRAIMDRDKIIGIVIIDIKPQVIIDAFGVNMMNGAATSVVVDENRHLVFCNNYAVTDDDINNFLDRIYSEDKYYTALDVKIDEAPHIMVGYKSHFTNLTSIVFIRKALLQKDYMMAINQTLIIALFIFLLSLIISILLATNITHKIKKLHNLIIEFDTGKSEHYKQIGQIKSNDEIGKLSTAFVTMMDIITDQIDNIIKLERQKRKYEIKALEAQINPHFLYNTLNTIKHLADIQKINNISDITASLIDLLKYSVSIDNQYVYIDDEINYINNYLSIQQYKYYNKIEVTYDIDDEILQYMTIKMILQPIVENSLKHGLKSTNDGHIIIKGYKSNKDIEFKIIDNGVGIPQNKIDKIINPKPYNPQNQLSGIGICNVNERIKLFFGEPYGISIYSIEDMQTIVSIKIPALTEEDKYAI